MMQPKRLTKVKDIKAAFNTLFSKDPNALQKVKGLTAEAKAGFVVVTMWKHRHNGQIEGVPWHAQPIHHDVEIPLYIIPPYPRIDIEVAFYLNNEYQSIYLVAPLPREEEPRLTIEALFQLAIKEERELAMKKVRNDLNKGKYLDEATKEVAELEDTGYIKEGYVLHQFKNQKAPSTYHVRQQGSIYHIAIKKGDKLETRSPKSSRMKPILDKFKEGNFTKEEL